MLNREWLTEPLSQKLPVTFKTLNEIFKGASTLTPAFLAAHGTALAVSVVVLVLITEIKAQFRKDLAEEESIEYELNLFIDQEMTPLLEAMENELSRGKEEGDMRNRSKRIMEILHEKIGKLQSILHDIKIQMKRVIDGEERCTLYQRCSILIAVGGVMIPFALPSTLAASFVAGMLSGASVFGYNEFGKSKENYQKSLEKIKEMEIKAREAKERLTALHTNAQIENSRASTDG